MGRPFTVDSQSITRPGDTTAYASGDLVANNTTAGSVTPFLFSNCVFPGGKGLVRRAAVYASQNSITNGTFRVHMVTLVPTVPNGDNSAFGITTNIAAYLGYIEVPLLGTGAAGAKGWGWPPTPALPIPFTSVSGSIWGLLEARAAYAPTASQTFLLTLELEN